MSDERDDIRRTNEDDGTEALTRLQEELKEVRRERQEYLDGWQRARADFANLKSAEALRHQSLEEDVTARIAGKLLPLIDSFEAAMDAAGWDDLPKNWKDGMVSVYKEFQKALKELGIESYDPLGEEFDPEVHVPTGRTGEGEKVVKVERRGYRLKQKVIRPAFVTLGD